jgi:predicted transcriptional regulator of viral defense system
MNASPFLSNSSTQLPIDQLIAALATRQHGVVSRKQLRELKLSSGDITYRCKVGRLHRVYRGVYSVGHSDVSIAGRRMAATLACGPKAYISHLTAGLEWELLDAPELPIHVTTARSKKPKLKDIDPHLSALPADEVGVMDGVLPITNLARTVLDLAATDLGDIRLRVVVAKAKCDADVKALIERYPIRRGVPRLRRILAAKPLVGLPASDLEIEFLEWLVARKLPLPELNQRLYINGTTIYPDCLWRDQKVIAEVDSKRHHDNWAQRTSDMARHTALAALGWRTVYVTKAALTEGYALERDLRRALGRVAAA